MPTRLLDNEIDLLKRVSLGDQEAFCKLFNFYQKFVYAFGKRVTHSDEMAEEIVQDVFLKIWLNRQQLDKLVNFGAYLNRVVRNHSLNVLRQLSQEAKIKQQIGLILTEVDDTTQQHLNHNEILGIFNDALARLPVQQRLAYDLCHQQGLKYQEAAERMQISAQTVHYHLKLASQSIRDYFISKSIIYPTLMLCLFMAK